MAVAACLVGMAGVAVAVGSRIDVKDFRSVDLAGGGVQVQVIQGDGCTSTGCDTNVFALGHGWVFQANREYDLALFPDPSCTGAATVAAEWLPTNSQLRTARGSAPLDSRLADFGSVAITTDHDGNSTYVVSCAAL